MKPKCPLIQAWLSVEMSWNDLSEISEVTVNKFEKKKDLGHPNEMYKKKNSTEPDLAEFCPVQENFGWNTPAGMHCSFDDFLPAESSERPQQKSVILNRYCLDYTASSAPTTTTHEKERCIESESQIVSPSSNMSFLYKRRSGQSNLWYTM